MDVCAWCWKLFDDEELVNGVCFWCLYKKRPSETSGWKLSSFNDGFARNRRVN